MLSKKFSIFLLPMSLSLVLVSEGHGQLANTKIAFVSLRDGNAEIYLMNPDGSGQTRLTNNAANDGCPAWSPDGTKIAFCSDRDGNLEIYVMNSDGTSQTRLTNNTARDASPTWSPDSSKIAFSSDRDGNFEIYVMDAVDADNDGNGENQIRLTNSAGFDDQPTWSPDGMRIAFDSFRDGNQEIYVMDAVDVDNDGNGENLVRLTNNPAGDGAAAWSPDGTRMAFHTDRGGDTEICVMDAVDTDNDGNGDNFFCLTNNSARDEDPVWSPDGTKIAFWSDRQGNAEIYVMNSDGTNQTRLTNNPAEDHSPTWSPRPIVSIDIKPGSFPNSINRGSGGTVPVAILSTTTFDARTVDPTTVTLASAPVALKGKGTLMSSVEDVDGDGLLDLVIHVQTEALQLSETDTEAVLEGKTFNGAPIRGTDSIRVVP
jgi:Tol biopolymer transport system component